MIINYIPDNSTLISIVSATYRTYIKLTFKMLVFCYGKLKTLKCINYWRLRRFVSQYDNFMQNFDILLTPTLGTTVPELGFFGPEVSGQEHWERIINFLPFTKYQNISGAPAITLPCGTDSRGLPIGIQLSSPLGKDRLLLKVSLQLEQNSSWKSLNI